MGELVFLAIIFLPLVLILWLANLADRQRQEEQPAQTYSMLTYGTLVVFWGFLFGVGVLLSLAGLLVRALPGLAESPASELPDAAMMAEVVAALPKFGLSLWFPAIFGVLFLLPPVRRLFARFISIDPTRAVHAVALSYTMLIIVQMGILLAIGLDALADSVEAGPDVGVNDLVSLTWVQNAFFVLMAIVGVGWLVRRLWNQSWQRIGVVRPSFKQIGLGIGLGLLLVAALIPLEYLVDLTGFGFDEDVARLSEELVGPMMTSALGILTLGLAAALGEESVFRGALQPRFGLLLTALLFALLHSQYGITLSTLIVFMLGLVLGWVRIRYNTSTSMIVHAVYNMTLGLLSFLNFWPEF